MAGIGIFDLSGSYDLNLDPMTFIYELDPYSVEIYRMCENEFPTSTLSKVIVCNGVNAVNRHFSSDRQTDGAEIIYHADSPVVN